MGLSTRLPSKVLEGLELNQSAGKEVLLGHEDLLDVVGVGHRR